MSCLSRSFIAISFLAATYSFAAGYVLPNGTILYDNSDDGNVYKIEKLTPQSNHDVAVVTNQVVLSQPFQTNSIIVEERRVVYEKPVYIRERVIDRRPVYDVVDAVGAVLIYGLIYDASRRSFFHHELHKNHKYNRYTR